jgi:hypothetical protein
MTPSATRRTSRRPPPDRRRIVLDEDINWRLSYDLRRRGRPDATALHLEGLNESKDGALLKKLGAYEPCVLVTWDNKMEFVHAAELKHHGITVAVVDRRPFQRGEWADTEEAYVRDVVHRRLHRIELQVARTVQRYR